MYTGKRSPCSALNVNTAILKVMRCCIGNQCSWRRELVALSLRACLGVSDKACCRILKSLKSCDVIVCGTEQLLVYCSGPNGMLPWRLTHVLLSVESGNGEPTRCCADAASKCWSYVTLALSYPGVYQDGHLVDVMVDNDSHVVLMSLLNESTSNAR